MKSVDFEKLLLCKCANLFISAINVRTGNGLALNAEMCK